MGLFESKKEKYWDSLVSHLKKIGKVEANASDTEILEDILAETDTPKKEKDTSSEKSVDPSEFKRLQEEVASIKEDLTKLASRSKSVDGNKSDTEDGSYSTAQAPKF